MPMGVPSNKRGHSAKKPGRLWGRTTGKWFIASTISGDVFTMDTEWTKHGFLSMNLKVGCVCPQRAASLGIRSPAHWIHIHENLSISRRFCDSEAGRACPKRAVVRVPAYIRGALRTTLPTSSVPAMPAWGQTRPTLRFMERSFTHVFTG